MNRRIWQIATVLLTALLLGTVVAVVAHAMAPKAGELPKEQVFDADAHPTAVTTPTVITVTSSLDTSGDDQVTTCHYSGSGGYHAASPCSFRRALVEASAVPAADRPVSIIFRLPLSDTNYNSGLGVWTLEVDATLPAMDTPTILEPDGLVTIDGSTQPGGRTDGPKIIVDSAYSLEVESEGNVIRHIGWKGGGAILLKEVSNVGGYNTVEHLVMGLSDDGTEIAFEDPGDPDQLAGGGMLVTSDGNLIQNSRIAGSTGRAINLEGSDNVVQDNTIGTRADGTVPDVSEAIECVKSFTYYPDSWYGGWGIQVSGSNNQILSNIIAGLHQMQSENDTPPMALEIFGVGHLVQNNSIGRDSAGSDVGVCGQGIKVAGHDTQVLDNLVIDSKSGFVDGSDDSPTEGAIFVNDTSPTFGQITIRGNVVITSPGKVIEFGPGLGSSDPLKLFNPARITGINGTTVTGVSGDDSPCPNCVVELYLDDLDDNEEALEVLAVVTATATGDFTAILDAPIGDGYGIRTGSTAQSSGVIGTYGAGTSTKLSQLYVPLASDSDFNVYLPLLVR